MQDLVDKAGLNEKISVASAASKPVDGGILHQGIAAKLRMENIDFDNHRAHTITPEDYATSDLIVCMDAGNIEQVKKILGGDPDGKISTLLDTDISWSSDFSAMFNDIKRGCEALLKKIG